MILVAYPWPWTTQTASVLVIQVHSWIDSSQTPVLLLLVGSLRMAYCWSLYLAPIKPPVTAWLIPIIPGMDSGLRITSFHLVHLHCIGEGEPTSDWLNNSIYFAKCFCCMSHTLLFMAVNICCFGSHTKSLREIKQILSKEETVNTADHLVMSRR